MYYIFKINPLKNYWADSDSVKYLKSLFSVENIIKRNDANWITGVTN